MNNPLVSVIIPTYNRPETLTRSIDSVLNQSYSNIEVIVVDDNNPDSEGRMLTEKIMLQYSENNRIKYIKHKQNINGSAARNTGFKNSQGEFIAFLDDDDEFLSEKIEKQLKRLLELPDNYAFCYTKFVTKKGAKLLTKSVESREGDMFLEALKRRFNVAAGSNLLIKRQAFETIGGFDETFSRNQDLELLVKLLSKYKVGFADTEGLIVYAHQESRKIDFEKVTNLYLQKFAPIIKTLNTEDRKSFNNAINMQRFRSFMHNNQILDGCIPMIKRGEISLFSSIILLYTLAKGRIFRKTAKV